jgi:hypothetical protein
LHAAALAGEQAIIDVARLERDRAFDASAAGPAGGGRSTPNRGRAAAICVAALGESPHAVTIALLADEN